EDREQPGTELRPPGDHPDPGRRGEGNVNGPARQLEDRAMRTIVEHDAREHHRRQGNGPPPPARAARTGAKGHGRDGNEVPDVVDRGNQPEADSDDDQRDGGNHESSLEKASTVQVLTLTSGNPAINTDTFNHRLAQAELRVPS